MRRRTSRSLVASSAGRARGRPGLTPWSRRPAYAVSLRHCSRQQLERPRRGQPGHRPVPPTGATELAKRDPQPDDRSAALRLARSDGHARGRRGDGPVATGRRCRWARMACRGVGVSHNAAAKRRTAPRSTRRSGAGACGRCSWSSPPSSCFPPTGWASPTRDELVTDRYRHDRPSLDSGASAARTPGRGGGNLTVRGTHAARDPHLRHAAEDGRAPMSDLHTVGLGRRREADSNGCEECLPSARDGCTSA